MATELRKLLDYDADNTWSCCVSQAITTILDRRSPAYVIVSDEIEYVGDDNRSLLFNRIDNAKAFLARQGIGEAEIEAQEIFFDEVR